MENTRTPSKWRPEFITLVYQFALLGATDKELALVFDVDPMTIDLWKRTHPEFLEALQRGKLLADAKVAESLNKCANGYEYEEEVAHVCDKEVVITKIRRYAKPDAWAANKWLSLRRRGDWSETHRVDIRNTNVNVNLNLANLSDDELKLLYSIGIKSLPQNTSDGSNG